ncbi:hypothetical protein HDV63DRAFT_381149 [Trichoderma sp. SZMC 28014]
MPCESFLEPCRPCAGLGEMLLVTLLALLVARMFWVLRHLGLSRRVFLRYYSRMRVPALLFDAVWQLNWWWIGPAL